jgi:hypothetical protein
MFSVEFTRDFVTPQGTNSETIRVPLETLVWNADTYWPMKRAPWAFTGSRYIEIEGKKIMAATKEQSVAAIRSDADALFNTVLDTYAQADIPQGGSGLYDPNFLMTPQSDAPDERFKVKLVIEPWQGGELKADDLQDLRNPKAKPSSKEPTTESSKAPTQEKEQP